MITGIINMINNIIYTISNRVICSPITRAISKDSRGRTFFISSNVLQCCKLNNGIVDELQHRQGHPQIDPNQFP